MPSDSAIPSNILSVPAIADRLRRTRLALGLTQAELCRRSGLATNTYNQWESARGRPELDKAIQLCETFALTLDWIYRGDPSGLPHSIAVNLKDIESQPVENHGATVWAGVTAVLRELRTVIVEGLPYERRLALINRIEADLKRRGLEGKLATPRARRSFSDVIQILRLWASVEIPGKLRKKLLEFIDAAIDRNDKRLAELREELKQMDEARRQLPSDQTENGATPPRQGKA